MTLALAGGHKVSGKQNLLASFSGTFEQNGMKFDEAMKRFKLKLLIKILSRFDVIKGNNCCFTDCINPPPPKKKKQPKKQQNKTKQKL